MKKLRGSEKIGKILLEFPQTKKVFQSLEMDCSEGQLSLVEAARQAKVPLQLLLNNLSKAAGVEVEWPKVQGMEGKSSFEASSNLKAGKPSGVEKIIAVHSGKGGVGKTFISIALAIGLARAGKKVGLLDLDIDCPNIPKILGLENKLIANQHKKITPLNYEGIKIVSMAGIQERDDLAIMWRGPIMAKAIEQMLHDTDWGDLDILIVDLPPGTSDAPLTLFNLIKPEGVLVVTTPQITAQTDAAKSIDMCKSMGVKVLGLVENMTGAVFGLANAQKMTKRLEINYLGELPLSAEYNKNNFWKKNFDQNLLAIIKSVSKKLFS